MIANINTVCFDKTCISKTRSDIELDTYVEYSKHIPHDNYGWSILFWLKNLCRSIVNFDPFEEWSWTEDTDKCNGGLIVEHFRPFIFRIL